MTQSIEALFRAWLDDWYEGDDCPGRSHEDDLFEAYSAGFMDGVDFRG